MVISGNHGCGHGGVVVAWWETGGWQRGERERERERERDSLNLAEHCLCGAPLQLLGIAFPHSDTTLKLSQADHLHGNDYITLYAEAQC